MNWHPTITKNPRPHGTGLTGYSIRGHRIYPQDSMFAPGIVIYEKSTRWEALLKRYFQSRDVQVRPCRLPGQVLTTLAAMPGSVTVVDLAAGTAQGLRLIAQARQVVPAGEVIVVAPETLVDLEWPAYEFGALAFLPDSVSGDALGAICARQLRQGALSD